MFEVVVFENNLKSLNENKTAACWSEVFETHEEAKAYYREVILQNDMFNLHCGGLAVYDTILIIEGAEDPQPVRITEMEV